MKKFSGPLTIYFVKYPVLSCEQNQLTYVIGELPHERLMSSRFIDEQAT